MARPAGAYAAWAANAVLLSAGQARQSDEIYYFLVVTTTVLAAFGLVELMRHLMSVTGWTWRRATSVALLLWFPLTLPWWLRSSEMDPHFRLSLEPIPERLTTLREWIREHSNGKTLFRVADIAVWIPALTGRRVLRTGMPWLNSAAYEFERILLFPKSDEEGRAALRQLRIDYLVLDPLCGTSTNSSPTTSIVFVGSSSFSRPPTSTSIGSGGNRESR